jgi:serine/threonine-protein kinase TTK/MPS1
VDPTTGTKKSQDVVPLSKDSILQTKNPVAVIRETHEDASPFPGTITKTFDESFNPFDGQREQPESVIATKEDNQVPLTCVESQLVEGKRKVQFLTVNKATSQGNILLLAFLSDRLKVGFVGLLVVCHLI